MKLLGIYVSFYYGSNLILLHQKLNCTFLNSIIVTNFRKAEHAKSVTRICVDLRRQSHLRPPFIILECCSLRTEIEFDNLDDEILFEFKSENITFLGVTQIIVEWENYQDESFCELNFASPHFDRELNNGKV